MKSAINILFLGLITVFASAPLTLAQEKENPIDRSLNACLKKNYSTVGMVQCIDKAYENWDQELNQIYQALRDRLDESGKKSLTKSQLAWLKYRDLEFKVINNIYSQMQGTMYIPMAASRRVEITKSRTIELQDYLDLLRQK